MEEMAVWQIWWKWQTCFLETFQKTKVINSNKKNSSLPGWGWITVLVSQHVEKTMSKNIQAKYPGMKPQNLDNLNDNGK